MKLKENDKKLFERLKRGDRSAFDALYDSRAAQVYGFFRRTLFDKSLAEDLTQEFFLRLWKYRETIDTDRNFDAWLFTVARNLVYREGRQMLLADEYSRHQQIDEDSHMDSTGDVVDYVFASEFVERIIETMPPARREVYRLKQQGFSVGEIAERLGIAYKTAETQLYNANQFMREKCREIRDGDALTQKKSG